ncbi:hypothetical protein EYF80_065780 [Liparis tanakae]|uniref:Uncharacterized protein n=1 Tax=Liparis tanakae TaxID=230148 RepID=A0A4Z2E5N8_9TELE|nr:hypothetical protein EYF80_065780 [Liparis tanakae]
MPSVSGLAGCPVGSVQNDVFSLRIWTWSGSGCVDVVSGIREAKKLLNPPESILITFDMSALRSAAATVTQHAVSSV